MSDMGGPPPWGGLPKSRKMKVLRMGLPGVENVPTPRGSIFKLSRASQLPYTKIFSEDSIFIYKKSIFFMG